MKQNDGSSILGTNINPKYQHKTKNIYFKRITKTISNKPNIHRIQNNTVKVKYLL